MPTQFDQYWDIFSRKYKVGRLFGIRSTGGLTKHWANTLWRVAVLIGRSQQADSRSEAFLLMMMALDTLLLFRFDKAEILATRLEGLFGGTALRFSLAARVPELYDKRCAIVHDGRTDVVAPLDLHQLDFCAVNGFRQVWKLRKWRCKVDLLDFADRRGAAKKWTRRDGLELWNLPYKRYEQMAP